MLWFVALALQLLLVHVCTVQVAAIPLEICMYLKSSEAGEDDNFTSQLDMVRPGVDYKEYATHTVVVQTPLSRFDVINTQPLIP